MTGAPRERGARLRLQEISVTLRPHRLLCLLPLLCGLPLSVHAGPSLEAIEQLSQAGTPQLALHLLDAARPDPAADPAAWFAWEQESVRLLEARGAWGRIAARLASLPDGLDPQARRWAQGQRASALLAAGSPKAAREQLRGLLWSAPADTDRTTLQGWRRQVIRSYLDQGLSDDALTATRLYRQDYGDVGEGWLPLAARVFLAAGRPATVEQLLAQAPVDGELGALQLLARLRQDPTSATEVLAAAQQGQDAPGLYAAVAAEAARRADDPRARAAALERCFAAGCPGAPLFRFSADELWDAYRRYGEALGNQYQLLIGQDDAWQAAAGQAAAEHPLQARALYAVLAQEGSTSEVRGLAEGRLAALLEQAGLGADLFALYLHSHRFGVNAPIPAAVRYRLAERALAAGRGRRAAALLQGVDATPAGVDAVAWAITRARVGIAAGRAGAAAKDLAALLQKVPNLSPGQLAGLAQTVAELKRAGAAAAALPLADRLLAAAADPAARRARRFQRAGLRLAAGQAAAAALDYLQAAPGADGKPDGLSPLARLRAAQALAAAGMLSDARALLQALSKGGDPGLAAVAAQTLQGLGQGG